VQTYCVHKATEIQRAFVTHEAQKNIDSVIARTKQLANNIKGELNLDNKWQSDDLFYIIMNEIHPRFNQF